MASIIVKYVCKFVTTATTKLWGTLIREERGERV